MGQKKKNRPWWPEREEDQTLANRPVWLVATVPSGGRRSGQWPLPSWLKKKILSFRVASRVELLRLCLLPFVAGQQLRQMKHTTDVNENAASLPLEPVPDAVQNTSRDTARKEAKLEASWSTVGYFVALLLIVASVALIRSRESLFEKNRRHIPCSTSVCLREALSLKDALDQSTHPCDDFYSFVCGKWTPRFPRSPGVSRDTLESVNQGVLKAIDGGRNDLGSAVSKAERMFKMCMTSSRQSAADVEDLKDFMSRRGLSWPDDVQNPGRHPLDILLDLAINWNVGLFFSVRVKHVSKRRPLIQIDKGSVSPTWMNFLDSIQNANRYLSYVHGYYLYFHNASPSASVIEDLRRDEKLVLQNLSSCFSGRRELSFVINQITALATPKTPSSSWLGLLNKHFDPFIVFRTTDRVYVSNVKLLRVVDMLIYNINSSRVRLNIAWTFLQMYSWLASVDNPVKDIPDSNLFLKSNVTCLALAERTYGLAVRARFIREISERDRSEVERIRYTIDQSFISHFISTAWIDATSRVVALRKLRTMDVGLWPPDIVFSGLGLEDMFARFPEPQGSLLKTWLRSQKARRSLLGHKDYSSVFNFDTEVPLRYMYSINVLAVSLSATGTPFFVDGGTSAMNYGGFGAHYAAAVARAFDSLGTLYDAEARNALWWSQSSYKDYERRTTCRSSSDMAVEHSQLQHLIPGLEAAFAAYRQSKSNVLKVPQWRAKNLEEFPDDQIFFINFCHAFCASTPTAFQRASCNVPLKNLWTFSDAFLCPLNSTMNPVEKCGFFDAQKVTI
ncbi:endothelin-converting enzyme 2-like [Ornithodoros turicata]|uniref:endothelin-converting enzyme 2-like n=1 Tax=Ornithodoros turicata TaxID=34597 RepID=UPI0031394E93